MTLADRVIHVVGVSSTIAPTEDTPIANLGMDSLEFLDLVLDFEREFGIKIPLEEAAMCERVADLTALIQSQC